MRTRWNETRHGPATSPATAATPRRSRSARSAARGIQAHAIYDGCWSFAAGQPDENRSIPDGWVIHVEQEHPYSTRLVLDTSAELAEVTREGGKPIDEEEA
jgi:hypothetical protein